MNSDNGELFVYLLIDNGLLQEASSGYTRAGAERRPPWLKPIYAERALEVSPFLIDIEAAYEAGAVDQFMSFVNARRPALHVSIIETGLDIGQIARHLRRFIFILDPEGKQFTLRFADCAVLVPLSSVLTAAQWTTMNAAISRWLSHDRSGAIIQLLSPEPCEHVQTPFSLDREQLASLDEASEVDHLIAKVKMLHHGEDLPGSAAQQYAWARAARQIWRIEKEMNPQFLTSLTEAVMVTRGEILKDKELSVYMSLDNLGDFRKKLKEFINSIRL